MEYKEVTVANYDDLKDGEMKQVSAGDVNILISRLEGNYHAVGATCPHYGAPLADGVLSGGRIVCPWHHACFDAVTGDLQEPPALDSLPRFDLRIENGRVVALIPDNAADRQTPEMIDRNLVADGRLFVIVGGGAAGYAAAQALREDGFQGRILMITTDERLPYDRPNLSKDYLQGHAQPEWMPLRPDQFFAEHGIEVMQGREVLHVNAAGKTITLNGGETLTYQTLLVASGGLPRKLNIPGNDLKNIYLLRSLADADMIMSACSGATRAIVIGASFIGMEAAFSLTVRNLQVTVVAPDSVPFEKTLGPEIGALFQRLHEEHGVTFKLGASVSRFEGNGRVETVVLDTGDRLETDLVLVGVGVHPATSFLEGITLDPDGGVKVNSHLRAADGLYAAGDIASFPSPQTGEHIRIEHWRTALQQGRTAAHNMSGKPHAVDCVPFFWTQQFDSCLQYVGHAKIWDEIIFQGDVGARDFLAFYAHNNRVVAVAGIGRDREIAVCEELLRLNLMPTAEQLKSNPPNLIELLR